MKLKLTIIILATAAVLHLSYVFANELPDLGDVSATVLTPLQEQAIAGHAHQGIGTLGVGMHQAVQQQHHAPVGHIVLDR